MDDLARFEPFVDAFLAGRLPGMNHARHVAIANVLRHYPHGRELLHLGLQVTAIRAGVPEKYSREVTDRYWEHLDGRLPAVEELSSTSACSSKAPS
ncbi:MAG: hypothetical protein ACAI25_09685 [Planctomycetota bacterium]